MRAPLQVAPITGPEKCALRPPRIVHVLQFNIHSGVSRFGPIGLAAIAQEIRAWHPDIVSLNEVDSDAARSGRTDEASYLAQATGMHDVFGANLVQSDGHRFGNAILSRYPVRESANIHLPRTSGSEPRGMLHAVLRVEGRTVDFYSVHLTQGARPASPSGSPRPRPSPASSAPATGRRSWPATSTPAPGPCRCGSCAATSSTPRSRAARAAATPFPREPR